MNREEPLLLFLDFDGVLHGFTGAPFTHSAKLARILRPYLGELEIVISSSWGSVHSLEKLKSFLPLEIAERVSDATLHYPKADDPDYVEKRRRARSTTSRYMDILFYLEHRPDAERWIAIDDDDRGWPEDQRHHLVHAAKDLGHSETQLKLCNALVYWMSPPVELAAARRLELARDWLVAGQVSERLGLGASNARQLATTRRRQGHLLGVWVPSKRAYRYPPWQFRPDGQPLWQTAEILRVLREDGDLTAHERRTSGWNEAEWFLSPHVLLDDRPPAELLIAHPDRVLAAATEQFVEDGNAGGF